MAWSRARARARARAWGGARDTARSPETYYGACYDTSNSTLDKQLAIACEIQLHGVGRTSLGGGCSLNLDLGAHANKLSGQVALSKHKVCPWTLVQLAKSCWFPFIKLGTI